MLMLIHLLIFVHRKTHYFQIVGQLSVLAQWDFQNLICGDWVKNSRRFSKNLSIKILHGQQAIVHILVNGNRNIL